MQCTSPKLFTGGKEALSEGFKGHEGRRLPCGRCRACRIARSREWYVRLWHENLYWDDAVFATFTYDDERFIEDTNLRKDDFQLLIKRIRSRVDRKIKYYGCGEYGERPYVLRGGKYPILVRGRPHYHIILFGVSVREHVTQPINQALRVVRGPLGDAWNKGMVVLGSVTKDSLRYVTDYVHKKLYGKAAASDGRVQPFSLCSQGLGRQFCIDHAEEYYYLLSQRVLGTELGMPRYYVKQLGLGDRLSERAAAMEVSRQVEDMDKFGWFSARRTDENRRLREMKDFGLEARSKLYGKEKL